VPFEYPNPALHPVHVLLSFDFTEQFAAVLLLHSFEPAAAHVLSPHAVQLFAPAAEYDPAGHLAQLLAPAAAAYPAPH
jgi:hypothetical protein